MSQPPGLRKFVRPPGPAPARRRRPSARRGRRRPCPIPRPCPIRCRPLSRPPRPRGTTPRNTASSAPPAYRPGTGTWPTWSSPAWPAPAGPATCSSPPQAAGRGRYRSVPDRYLRDSSRPMSAMEWDELQIPVGLAFFLNSSRAGPGRLLPEPGRRHRMHPRPGRVGAPGGRVSAAGRGGTRRGGRAAVPRQPRVRGGVLHRAHRRLLRAGRADADAVEGLRRRQ